MTATYEEIVVIAQSVEPPAVDGERDPHDTGDTAARLPTEHNTARASANDDNDDQDQDQERPAHHHNGHLRERDREGERDRSYTPAHLRPAFERDGTRAAPEAASAAEMGHDAQEFTPRGDVRGDVGPLIDDLRAIFQHDRTTASTTGGTRCGICYLHFALDALEYREDEGYYVCARCAQALGSARVPMVRRQKRS